MGPQAADPARHVQAGERREPGVHPAGLGLVGAGQALPLPGRAGADLLLVRARALRHRPALLLLRLAPRAAHPPHLPRRRQVPEEVRRLLGPVPPAGAQQDHPLHLLDPALPLLPLPLLARPSVYCRSLLWLDPLSTAAPFFG